MGQYFLRLLAFQTGLPEIAILDIDGSYTNEKKFPELPDEGLVLRTLNCFKNKMITQYDYLYKNEKSSPEKDTESFIKEVRQTFFKFLKPFLEDVPKFLNKNCLIDSRNVFSKYFNIN